MRFPPGVSKRKAAWPSHVRVVSGMRELLGVGRREPNEEGPSDAEREPSGVGSRLLPLVLATAALAAGAAGLGGLALWLGLLTVPAAAAAAFVAVSDTLEGRPALLRAVTSGVALALVVVASAARQNAATGHASSPLATWGLLFALLAYGVPSSSGCSSRCASRSGRARSAACGPPRSTSSSRAPPSRAAPRRGAGRHHDSVCLRQVDAEGDGAARGHATEDRLARLCRAGEHR